jgi:beta-glucanase (GH16 family)
MRLAKRVIGRDKNYLLYSTLAQNNFRLRRGDLVGINGAYEDEPASTLLNQLKYRFRVGDLVGVNGAFVEDIGDSQLGQLLYRFRSSDGIGLNEAFIEESFGGSEDPIGIAGTWNLIKSDHFENSSLDTTLWRPGWFGSTITNPVNSYEGQGYNANHVTFPGDGFMHLKFTQTQITPPDGITRPYTGSLVSTNPSDGRASGGFSFTYGAVEVRAFIPAKPGSPVANWPAIWTNGQSPWPSNGETDIMEGLSGSAKWHYHSTDGSGKHQGPGGTPSGTWTGWHTFAYSWDPGNITFYWDGVNVGSVTSNVKAAPHYIVLNNAVSSPTSSHALAPVDMLIDYVKVWQRA